MRQLNTRTITSRISLAWIGLAVSGCGSGGAADLAAPVPPPAGSDPVAAAKATAENNPMCVSSRLGSYYWEIGDANGVLASGTVGSSPPSRTSPLWVYSASKWLYAASVVQKRGVVSSDVPFLNFTSGWSNFGNLPVCLLGDTVGDCLIGRDSLDSAAVGRFKYDSGHMQHHAATVMGLGGADNAALAADLNATVGNLGFSYTVPQLAAGVVATPAAYAAFLQKVMRGELALGAALGTHKTCANPATPGCNALEAPATTGEGLNYSLGHWVEDDPTVGDHAFSSPGGGGFYPWIDASKSYYGILARERPGEGGAGFNSLECGRLIRQAWRTGAEVTGAAPVPQ
jgi:hypothetical protein